MGNAEMGMLGRRETKIWKSVRFTQTGIRRATLGFRGEAGDVARNDS